MLELGKLLTALIAPPLNTFVLLIIAAIFYRVHFKKLAKFRQNLVKSLKILKAKYV